MLYNKPITKFSNLVVSRVDYCVIDYFVSIAVLIAS